MGDWETYTITLTGWKAKAVLIAIILLAFYGGYEFGARP